MNVSEYQQLAMRTSGEGHDRILNGCLGLMGEAGEVVDVIKKWRFQSGENPPFPVAELVNEIGDILWYCAEFCTGRGVDLARVVEYVDKTADDTVETHPLVMGPPEYHAFKLLSAALRVYGVYFNDLFGKPGMFKYPTRFVPGDDDNIEVVSSNGPLEIAYMDEQDKMDSGRYDSIVGTLTDIIRNARFMLVHFAGSSLTEAMEINIDKLRRRYPDGFDPERSLHRPE